MKPPFLKHDPQTAGPQYLEDLATGYWFSEVLFTAVEAEIFTLLATGGKTAGEIAGMLNYNRHGAERFLHALCAMGLLASDGEFFFNTGGSQEYLVKGKENYQGDSILWRQYLNSHWQSLGKCLEAGGRVNFPPPGESSGRIEERTRCYIRAMDGIARLKVQEIIPLFRSISLAGEMLDVGAGSGAFADGFLDYYPLLRATLLDLPRVLDNAEELMGKRGLAERVTCCPGNILEPWPVRNKRYDLIILSNIIHAYSEREVPGILARAAECLKPEGFLIIHDFFFEHCPEKAALSDLNMFINTYNGKVFSAPWVQEELKKQNLSVTGMIPLQTDSAVIIATAEEKNLAQLCVTPEARLAAGIKDLGFRRVCPLPVESVHVPGWVNLRCRFGCEYYGKPHCPPETIAPEKTRELLGNYNRALLLEGEPPGRTFQRRVLQAEREAFKAGFYKALTFWAGHCALCENCAPDGICRNNRDARPSMEGAGIDVFETVRRAGLSLRTLNKKSDYVKYFALLLLE
ncbi:MAG: methyltransferase domain-containing protein [Firmicutes bacterium]|nr:methyltransferase domain-containing protein [Bacillota bacterium]